MIILLPELLQDAWVWALPGREAAMTERLKRRHKVTGEEKGPYWGKPG
jgi:hypothetical protein